MSDDQRKILTVTFRLDSEEISFDIAINPEHWSRGPQFIHAVYFEPIVAHFLDWAQRNPGPPRFPDDDEVPYHPV